MFLGFSVEEFPVAAGLDETVMENILRKQTKQINVLRCVKPLQKPRGGLKSETRMNHQSPVKKSDLKFHFICLFILLL